MDWIIISYEWLISVGTETEADITLRVGLFWGIIGTIAIYYIVKWMIYFFFPRIRKVQEVRIPQEGGALFVSAGALIDMVNIVAGEFDYVDVTKVSIWESKSCICMKVKVKYDIKGKQYPELCLELKKAIQDNLQGRLGVDCIRIIEVKNDKTSGTLNSKF